MNLKSLCFIIAIFIGVQNVKSQNDPHLIKILTYNIYHGENPNQPGTPNLEDIARLVDQLEPDMIALQEIDSMTLRSEKIFGRKMDLIAELTNQIGYSGYFGKAMAYGEGGYGVGLLVKDGSDFKTQILPSPEGGEPRVAAWVKVKLQSQKEIYFAAVHLSNESAANRQAQLDELTSYADTLSLPSIFAGDFNFAPESKEYKSMPLKWKDAGHITADTSATYPGENGKRIDYIWYSSENFELVDYRVLTVPYSDHFPVLVTLRIKPKPL